MNAFLVYLAGRAVRRLEARAARLRARANELEADARLLRGFGLVLFSGEDPSAEPSDGAEPDAADLDDLAGGDEPDDATERCVSYSDDRDVSTPADDKP